MKLLRYQIHARTIQVEALKSPGKTKFSLCIGMALLLPAFDGRAGSAVARRTVSAPSAAAASASASVIHPPPARYVFPRSTTYYYKAEYRLLPVGVASLHIERGANGSQRVTAAADATGIVARLFHVHDVFNSAFDETSFCALTLSKHTEEGRRKRDSTLRFDYARRKSVLDEVNLKNNDRKHAENSIPACVMDVLSGLVYAASLPLAPNVTYAYPLNDGGETADLEIHVEGRETLHTEAGVFNTIRVEPKTDLAFLKDRGQVWVWYSDDARRIPVQMRGHLGWGTLTLTLQRIESAPAAPASSSPSTWPNP